MAVVAAVFLILLFLFGMGVAYTLGFGYDSHAYWVAAQDLGHLYERPPLARDAYLYSPAFVVLLWPLAQLPWPIFAVSLGRPLWPAVSSGSSEGCRLSGSSWWLSRAFPRCSPATSTP